MIKYTTAAQLTLWVGALAFVGCDEPAADKDAPAPNAPAATATPSSTTDSVIKADTKSTPAPAEPSPTTEKPSETKEAAKEAPAVAPKSLEEVAATAPAAEAAVTLEPVKFDAYLARLAQNKTSKYTVVDVWASWCIPCKENFPHLLELNKKYESQGLKVASLSFDDPSDPKQVEAAKKFLNEKKATITNFLLDEEAGLGNEKLNISAIPAVFIYDPNGKEVKRFTLDDPNHQFTYDDVEKAIVALLEGKPIPETGKDKPAAK